MASSSLEHSGVYAIQNTLSGRIYVGSAARIERRWRTHRWRLRIKKHHSPALQRSWDKHGPPAFLFLILEVVEDPDARMAREQYWIETLHAACPKLGFNVQPNAGGWRGHKHSEEARAKISAVHKGRKCAPFTAEHKAALSAARRRHRHSEATKVAMSVARKGRKLSLTAVEREARRARAVARNRVKGQGQFVFTP